MEKLTLEVGEEVVYCPLTVNVRWRGAEGIIISRCTSTRKSGKKRVRSILVRWNRYRKGVSCFRVTGRSTAKSDSWKINDWIKYNWEGTHHHQLRFEEPMKDIHPMSYCHKCPYRLQRLVGVCKFSKEC